MRSRLDDRCCFMTGEESPDSRGQCAG